MSEAHGKDVYFVVNGDEYFKALKSITVGLSAETHDSTVFGDDWKGFALGLKSVAISGDGLFLTGSGMSFADMAADFGQGGNIATAYFPDSSVQTGQAGIGMITVMDALSKTISVDDLVGVSLNMLASGAAEWLRSLLLFQALTVTGNGNQVDNGAATTDGGSAYINAVTAAGTTPTLDVEVRHSSDAFVGDDTLLATFSQLTTVGAERVTFSGTVKRWTRAKWTLGGTSPSFETGIGIHRA